MRLEIRIKIINTIRYREVMHLCMMMLMKMIFGIRTQKVLQEVIMKVI
jgi:hypothetical protein